MTSSDDTPEDLSESRFSRTDVFSWAALGIAFGCGTLFGLLMAVIGRKTAGRALPEFVNGTLFFLGLLAALLLGALLLVMAVRVTVSLLPAGLRVLPERRRLKKSRGQAEQAIARRQELLEEQTRVTACLQAAFLFEKESGRLTNRRATEEFQKALQTGVLRSCDVVFDHITEVTANYERVLDEIDAAPLSRDQKQDLLDSLSRELDPQLLEDRQRNATRIMEAAIWKVRLQKAETMAESHPRRAAAYLKRIRKTAPGNRLKLKIDRLLQQLPTT